MRAFVRAMLAAYGSSGGQATATLTETDWYAPGVGLVRATTDDPLAPELRLAGYDVGGASAGVSDGRQLFFRPAQDSAPRCPAIAAGGGRVLGAFLGGLGPGARVEVVGMDPSAGSVFEAQALDGVLGQPAAAFDGTRFLVVAADDNAARAVVRAQRYGLDGAPLDPAAGITLATAEALGGGGLVLGSEQAVRALRLGPDGAPRDAAPIEVSSPGGPQTEVRVTAAGATGWLVTWTAYRGHRDPYFDTLYTDATAARVSAEGSVDPPPPSRGLALGGGDEGDRRTGSAAFAGGRWVAAFAIDDPAGTLDGIRAVPLDLTASPVMPGGGVGLDASGPPRGDVLDCPALVVPDDGRALLVWRRQEGTPPGGLGLDAVRVGW